MNKLKHKSNERRTVNYHLLRDVGYTSREANRFKDAKDTKIRALIDERINHNLNILTIVGGQ